MKWQDVLKNINHEENLQTLYEKIPRGFFEEEDLTPEVLNNFVNHRMFDDLPNFREVDTGVSSIMTIKGDLDIPADEYGNNNFTYVIQKYPNEYFQNVEYKNKDGAPVGGFMVSSSGVPDTNWLKIVEGAITMKLLLRSVPLERALIMLGYKSPYFQDIVSQIIRGSYRFDDPIGYEMNLHDFYQEIADLNPDKPLLGMGEDMR